MHPLTIDVVLGRGWHQQEHPGNLRLARIVDEHRQIYKDSRKLHKTHLNWKIVELVRESGGRFLERSPGGGWVQASDESARDKVSKCFRTQTKRSSTKAPSPSEKNKPVQRQHGGKHGITSADIPMSSDHAPLFQTKKPRMDA